MDFDIISVYNFNFTQVMFWDTRSRVVSGVWGDRVVENVGGDVLERPLAARVVVRHDRVVENAAIDGRHDRRPTWSLHAASPAAGAHPFFHVSRPAVRELALAAQRISPGHVLAVPDESLHHRHRVR